MSKPKSDEQKPESSAAKLAAIRAALAEHDLKSAAEHDAMVAQAQALALELGQAQQTQATAQRAAALASTGAVIAELGHDGEADAQNAHAQQQARSEAQAKRLGAAIAGAETELAALVALDTEHGVHLDGLMEYYDGRKSVPGHYDYTALQRLVLVPAWQTLRSLRTQILSFREVIPEARRIVERGWRPGQEWALHVEETVLSLTRPQGLAATLRDQIGTLSGHLKRLAVAARLRKQSGAAPTERITLPPITVKSKPAQDPSVEQANLTWNPFK
jgi:hypothetical protein